jgi:hypothetical protein
MKDFSDASVFVIVDKKLVFQEYFKWFKSRMVLPLDDINFKSYLGEKSSEIMTNVRYGSRVKVLWVARAVQHSESCDAETCQVIETGSIVDNLGLGDFLESSEEWCRIVTKSTFKEANAKLQRYLKYNPIAHSQHNALFLQ